MLLNEFLKEHQTVQQQGATIARLEKQVGVLTAGLQKVSAQIEMSRPAPEVVANNRVTADRSTVHIHWLL
jgi:hypothetical protein